MEQQKGKGHLKIFFSYAEGMGKTQAMLKAAKAAKSEGMDVLVGYIAPHTYCQVRSSLKEFEQLHTDCTGELEIDQVLARKPELILIDELAHSNEKNSRHRMRYQDIDELRKAGISVYTTVNVGNIESLHDTVTWITGIDRWDRIPDFVFDDADEVEFLDMEPQELMNRQRMIRNSHSQLTLEQLSALREISFRRCADRIKRHSKRNNRKSFHTDE